MSSDWEDIKDFVFFWKNRLPAEAFRQCCLSVGVKDYTDLDASTFKPFRANCEKAFEEAYGHSVPEWK